jgi:hypothetical protein
MICAKCGMIIGRAAIFCKRRRERAVARKKAKAKRVASVDAQGILVRDLKGTLLWIIVAAAVTAVLATAWQTMM